MRPFTFIFLLTVFLVSSLAPAASALVGGRELSEAELPHSVVLITVDNRATCGGGLVGPQLVLTAAHCVVDPITGRPLTSTRVAVSPPVVRYRFDQPLTGTVPVQQVKVSYAYATQRYGNDLALLRLSAPVPGGTPAPVGRPNLRAGSVLQLVAWGPTRLDAIRSPNRFDDPGRARGARFPVRSSSACTRLKAYRSFYEKSTMLCVGQPNRHHDTCPGDSGSPAFSGKAIVAVVSVSIDGSCEGKRPPGPVVLGRPDGEFLSLLRSEGVQVFAPQPKKATPAPSDTTPKRTDPSTTDEPTDPDWDTDTDTDTDDTDNDWVWNGGTPPGVPGCSTSNSSTSSSSSSNGGAAESSSSSSTRTCQNSSTTRGTR